MNWWWQKAVCKMQIDALLDDLSYRHNEDYEVSELQRLLAVDEVES